MWVVIDFNKETLRQDYIRANNVAWIRNYENCAQDSMLIIIYLNNEGCLQG